ncbi:MAG: hypothetical protein HKO95_05030 [Rhodobacteraceae bacterium]|nr:hypothetical protein [Alphaproteobacteria bacterium]NNF70887.1 hypothetical protein [Paracoccaceae bacterium]NNK66078.1 hypothetical protein [Paracoccaceae bacterium]
MSAAFIQGFMLLGWPIAVALVAFALRSKAARLILWIYASAWFLSEAARGAFRAWLRRNDCDDPLGDLHCQIAPFSESALRTIADTSFGLLLLLLVAAPAIAVFAAAAEWRVRRRR